MRKILGLFIKLYRLGISPLFAPSCRFVPTCSEYSLEAISRYGAVKGGWITIKRLSKCQPFMPLKDNYDPVPEKTLSSENQYAKLAVNDAADKTSNIYKGCI